MLTLILRFSHVFFGALWVGMMTYQVFVLMPALAKAGPDSGKVMAALMRSRIPILLPIFALVAIISGMWLFYRLGGGDMSVLMGSAMGQAFAWGGLSALVAFLMGIFVMRPIMMKAQRLAEAGSPGPELQQLRARGALLSKVVAFMLLFTLATMSVARYL